MIEMRPKYLSHDKTRHGQDRLYVRLNGKMIRIPFIEDFNDLAFCAAYEEAVQLLKTETQMKNIVSPRRV